MCRFEIGRFDGSMFLVFLVFLAFFIGYSQHLQHHLSTKNGA